MRFATVLLAISSIVGTAQAQNIEIVVAPSLKVEDFLSQMQLSTGGLYLFCEQDVEGLTMGGPFSLVVPQEKAAATMAFLLELKDLRIQPHGPVSSVLGPTVGATNYRLTGLDGTVAFNRPPAGWRRKADAAGSLTPASVERLVKLIRQPEGDGQAAAAALLGVAGPRDFSIVEALFGALETGDPALRARAAGALGSMGHAARPVLDRLAMAAERETGKLRAAYDAAIKQVSSSLHPGLLNPKLASEEPPATYSVLFKTTKGDFTILVTTKLAPLGSKRFYNLVRTGYFKDIAFFRVLDKKQFGIAQFGIHGNPAVNGAWRNARILDEPARASNRAGTICFAKTNQRHSRSVQFFINTTDNTNLDRLGFAPFGKVVEGMPVVRKLYAGYGEGAPNGRGPNQQRMQYEGIAYLKKAYPELDYIESAAIVK
ncbi:MAG: peptidylprolyl isomerase [Planctomycetota bacterium]|jgi:peptidyl-prolyl cis-trans isomerase A (cyclophilin A)